MLNRNPDALIFVVHDYTNTPGIRAVLMIKSSLGRMGVPGTSSMKMRKVLKSKITRR
jgi:hypothetical protein